MISDRARLNLAVAFALPGTILLGVGTWWFAWATLSWYSCLSAVVSGLLLVIAASQVAPKPPRRPRGGPMIDTDKTLTITRQPTDAVRHDDK
jgi:hypothetical protein